MTTIVCPLCKDKILDLTTHPTRPHRVVAYCNCGRKKPGCMIYETDKPKNTSYETKKEDSAYKKTIQDIENYNG